MTTVKPSSRWKDYKPRERSLKPILQDLKKAGKEVINVSGGDPVPYGFTNEPINEYLIKAVNEGWNMYPESTPWATQVKKAIADFEKRTRRSDYSPDDIIIAPGAQSALFAVHYSLLDLGDEVIAPDPSHYLGEPTSYWSCLGSKVVPFETDEAKDWTPDIDSLRSKITKKTKAIFLNNPNNPTAAVYNEKFLSQVVDVAGEHDLLLIGDEIYGLIVFEGKKTSSLGAIAKDVPAVVINGMSKFFMRTGWRFGYVALHDPAQKAPELMRTIKNAAAAYGHCSKGVPTPIVAAATMAYEHAPDKSSLEFVKELEKRRDFVMKRINEISGLSCVKPMGTLYAFPKVDLIPSVWKNDEEFLVDLLREEQVQLNAGSNYGKNGFGHFRTLLMPNIETQEEIYNRIDRLIRKRANK